MFDAGLDGDVCSDQQLQGADGRIVLYEAAVPEAGMNLENSFTREAVEWTLKHDTSGRPQQTVQLK